MCGIIGYTGSEDVREVLLDALELLEYRGYDSAVMYNHIFRDHHTA